MELSWNQIINRILILKTIIIITNLHSLIRRVIVTILNNSKYNMVPTSQNLER